MIHRTRQDSIYSTRTDDNEASSNFHVSDCGNGCNLYSLVVLVEVPLVELLEKRVVERLAVDAADGRVVRITAAFLGAGGTMIR
jgi:hypothetical protein